MEKSRRWVKGIIVKNGTYLEFKDTDKKAIIHLQTQGKNQIVLDDEAKSILIKDQHGNQIILSEDGIEIKSSKDIKIDASKGKVETNSQKQEMK